MAIRPQPEGEWPEADLVSTREALLKIVKLSFAGKQKWRFSDGASSFGAVILDKDFVQRIDERREGFYSGDTLRVILRIEQRSMKDGGFKSAYIIERVIQHLPSQKQYLLPEG